MKTQYQITHSKRRLVIFLLKLSTRGEIIKTNLRKLIKDIFDETGEIFAKTEYGLVFESFFSRSKFTEWIRLRLSSGS